MPGDRTDLGFSAVAVVIAAVLWLWARRRWRMAAERREEVKRLAWLAAEEAARIEAESLAYVVSPPPKTEEVYGDGGGGGGIPVMPPTLATLPPECAVCYRHTTSRCKRCKAVRYCSGKCQIIHWRQGHKDECHPPRIDDRCSGPESTYNSKGSQTDEPDISENSLDIKANAQVKTAEQSPARPSVESDRSSVVFSEVNNSDKPFTDTPGTESSSSSFVDSSSSSSSSSLSSSSSCSTFSVPLDTSDASSIDDPDPDVLHSKNLDKASLDNLSPDGPTTPVNNSAENSETNQFGSANFPVTNITQASNFKEVSKSKSEDVESSVRGPSESSFISSESWKIDRPLKDAAESKNDHVQMNAGSSSSFVVSTSSLPSQMIHAKKGSSDREADLSDRVASSEGSGQSNYRHSPASSSVASGKNADVWLSKSKSLGPLSSFTSVDHGSPPSGGKDSISLDSSSKKDNGPVLNKSSESIVPASNGISDLKTSVRRVVQQLKSSHISKHHSSVPRNVLSQKYKMLFPYDLFVKLYNCDKVELRPCGLTNCGNSCYANAVLQCLAFTRPLTSYLLQGYHTKTCPRRLWCFTCEFASLLVKAKQGQSPLSPIGILSHIHNIGSNLGPGRQEDAHEFLRYAIDTMQSVCLKEAGEHAVGKIAEETTLIQLIFGGYLRSKIKCTRCRGTSERHERMMDLTVEIHGDIGTLEEALARFTATEILDGENRYQCTRCKSYERAKKKLTVLEAPNVLTIALKRFQSGKFGKINKAVRFPEILDLAPYMSGTDKSPVYSLYGVVVHQDIMNAAFSGHYICYVKNTQGKWYKTDDSKVKPVEIGRVLSENAYMLLYARCSPRAPSLIRTSMSLDPLKTKRNQRFSTQERSHHDLPPPHGFFRPSSNVFSERLPFSRTDSSSDNSSLLSGSDGGSCSTESGRDSTSTDEYSEYIFGDSGRFSYSAFSDDSSRSFDGEREFVSYGREDPQILYSDTATNQFSKLTEESRSREWDRGGYVGLSEVKSSNVVMKRSSTSRERRAPAFY